MNSPVKITMKIPTNCINGILKVRLNSKYEK